jgi:hypothetical protein
MPATLIVVAVTPGALDPEPAGHWSELAGEVGAVDVAAEAGPAPKIAADEAAVTRAASATPTFLWLRKPPLLRSMPPPSFDAPTSAGDVNVNPR